MPAGHGIADNTEHETADILGTELPTIPDAGCGSCRVINSITAFIWSSGTARVEYRDLFSRRWYASAFGLSATVCLGILRLSGMVKELGARMIEWHVRGFELDVDLAWARSGGRVGVYFGLSRR